MTKEINKKTYSEKLKDSRWLKKRRTILERDNFTCQSCGDTEKVMHVHHEYYDSKAEPWEYPDKALVTLCDPCHQVEETNRKNVYREFNKAVADAGFTREDVEKLTWAFKGLSVTPMFSHVLAAGICRGISSAWHDLKEWNPIYTSDEGAEVEAIANHLKDRYNG